MEYYETERRNKNRGYMKLIVSHHEVENRLLRLMEKLEQKREDEDWIVRIAEDAEEYSTPPLHHSITPSLHHSTTRDA